MPKLRKFLFYCFLLIYIIYCPLLVLYALGITFRPGSQTLQKTGVIYLSTIPSEATVFINNRQFSETTPTLIRNLRSGKYNIKIWLKDYLPWTKFLDVEEEKATACERILLIPQSWNKQTISAAPYQDIIPFAQFPFLIVKNGPLVDDLWTVLWPEGLKEDIISNKDFSSTIKTSPLVLPQFEFPKTKINKIYSVPGSPFILIEGEFKSERKFFWINGALNAPEIKDITALFVKEPQAILWDPHAQNDVYIYAEGYLHALDISAQAIHLNLVDHVRSFTLHNNQIYVLTDDFQLKKFDKDGKNPKDLLEDSQLGAALFANDKKWEITVLTEEAILFLSENGALVTNHLPYQLAPKGIKGFQFDGNNKRLLVWTHDDIGYVDFNLKTGDELFEKGPQIKWLNIPQHNIRQAFWINRGAHILYVSEDEIFVTERESFDQFQVDSIAKIKSKTSIHYADAIGRVFFLDGETGQMMNIEVVPQTALLSLPSSEESKSDIAPLKEKGSP